MAVPGPSVVFTVKLPGALAEQIRAYARARDMTISAAVSGALSAYLAGADAESSADE
jgi:predicted transcriptional regulator